MNHPKYEKPYIVNKMIAELCSLKYGYLEIVEGCYDVLIHRCDNQGKTKQEVIDEVIKTMNKV